MKTQHLLLLACAATVLGTYAAEPTSNPHVVALRYVTAADAFTAVQQKLGANAAEAVSGVDEKRNTVALISTHAQVAIVRAFLTGFDHNPNDTDEIRRKRAKQIEERRRDERLGGALIVPRAKTNAPATQKKP